MFTKPERYLLVVTDYVRVVIGDILEYSTLARFEFSFLEITFVNEWSAKHSIAYVSIFAPAIVAPWSIMTYCIPVAFVPP